MKSKIITTFFIGFICILGLPFLLLFLSDFSGLGKKEGGFKTYEAFSPTKEGKNLIAQHKIKCIARDVECICFIDIGRGEIFFAYNIDYNNYYFYENIKYDKVPKDIVKKYQFNAHFTWLETYGKYIVNSMFGLCMLLWLVFWWFGKQ